MDPGNFSALVNMSEMIRRGHAVSGEGKKKVQEKLETFFKDANNRKYMREIARAILSNSKWRGFIPANAVMGSVAASEGDYVASERFFQVATDTTNKVATVVLNDYADTLMHLGKLDEAEKVARRAVKESDETFWVARLTLAEVLEKKEKVKAKGQGQEGEIDEAALAAFAVDAAARRIRKDGENSNQTRQAPRIAPAAQFPSVGGYAASTKEGTEIRTLLKSVLKYAPEQVHERIRKKCKGYMR